MKAASYIHASSFFDCLASLDSFQNSTEEQQRRMLDVMFESVGWTRDQYFEQYFADMDALADEEEEHLRCEVCETEGSGEHVCLWFPTLRVRLHPGCRKTLKSYDEKTFEKELREIAERTLEGDEEQEMEDYRVWLWKQDQPTEMPARREPRRHRQQDWYFSDLYHDCQDIAIEQLKKHTKIFEDEESRKLLSPQD